MKIRTELRKASDGYWEYGLCITGERFLYSITSDSYWSWDKTEAKRYDVAIKLEALCLRKLIQECIDTRLEAISIMQAEVAQLNARANSLNGADHD